MFKKISEVLYWFLLLYVGYSLSFTLRKDLFEREKVRIDFSGDVSFSRPVVKGNGSSCNYTHLLKYVSSYFAKADYTVVNLESPMVTRERTVNGMSFPEKYIHLFAWKESVESLTSGHINAVTLANNHIFDYGIESIELTKSVLMKSGVEYFGLSKGDGYSERQIPLTKEISGLEFGFLGYCSTGECYQYRKHVGEGPALPLEHHIREDVKQLKEVVDFVVVYMHWGREYLPLPDVEQVRLASLFAEIGVNLVVSSHPHVLRGHEWIGNTFVHYSLGNFVYHPHYIMFDKMNTKDIPDYHIRDAMRTKKYNAQSPLSQSEILEVTFERNASLNARYLPIEIVGDGETDCIYPRPLSDTWFDVCSPSDTHCYSPRI